MKYVLLSICVAAGYILMRIGTRYSKKILKICGWIVMIVCCVAMLVMRYGFKI